MNSSAISITQERGLDEQTREGLSLLRPPPKPRGYEHESQQLKNTMRDQRHQGGGDRAGKNRGDIVQGEAGNNGSTVASRPYQGRERRRADADDGRGLDPRQQRRARQRQHHLEKHLPAVQAERARVLQMDGVHRANAGEGVEHHRQQAVQAQRGQGGLGADAEYRNEKAQQRERRHRLNDRARQQDCLSGGVKTHRGHAERYADEHGEQQRYADQPQMLPGPARHLMQPSFRRRRFSAQKLRGYLVEGDFLNVGLRIHVEHGLFADPAFEPEKRLPLRRFLSDERLSRDPDRLIDGKIIVIVLEQLQIELFYFRIRRVDVDQIDRILIDGLKAQRMFHAVDFLRIEAQVITLDQSGIAVLSIHEFVAERGLHSGFDGNQVADRVQLVLFRILFFHRERVGIVESERAGNGQAHSGQSLPDLIEGLQIRALENGLRQSSAVIRVHVDRTALQCLE